MSNRNGGGQNPQGQMPAPPVGAASLDIKPHASDEEMLPNDGAGSDDSAPAAPVMPPPPAPFPDIKPKESDSIKAVPPSEGAIAVVANRAGFYKQSRKVEGDAFTIPSMDKLGDWMNLADPKAEKARRASDELKKKQEKKAGV